VPEVVPKDDDGPLLTERPIDDRFRAFMERHNCGFEKVERLDGNIGYVKFNSFGDPRVCGPTATAAFGFLAHVDAIIFDLRDNGGGDPSMVQYVASYLFAARTHLNDLWVRKSGKSTEYWTKPEPAFVLTSARTFSGGEEFTYDLKSLKRATIVGEATGGGAHPVSPHRLDDHFAIGVPFARPINPITKRDWEGTGVAPDVKVAADQALDVALKLANEQVRKAAPPKKK
jgi:C-terminal processing protease CtpA/Prc